MFAAAQRSCALFIAILIDACDEAPAPPQPPAELPEQLSRTGLYDSAADSGLAAGVRPFRPRFELWSDGAEKSRWIWLPGDGVINTQNMNRWRFPVGTKLWKEFRKAGKRLETRMIWKRAEPDEESSGWVLETYLWDDEERDAVRRRDGLVEARGTDHEVPPQAVCTDCHRAEYEAPIGFGAIQLSGDGEGLRLRELVEEGRVTMSPPTANGYSLPGGAKDQAALGYLHANCGGCHSVDSLVFRDYGMFLRLDVDRLATVETTLTFMTTRLRDTLSIKAGDTGRYRITPGSPQDSELYRRMGIREVGPDSLMMPPVGSHTVDTAGRKVLADWIMSFPIAN
jgi:hypothetical protein